MEGFLETVSTLSLRGANQPERAAVVLGAGAAGAAGGSSFSQLWVLLGRPA